MADEGPTATAVSEALTQPPATEGEKPEPELGDGGKKALDAERKARAAAEKQAKQLETRLRELEDASKSESEKAIEAARTEAAQEARNALTREFGHRIAGAEIKAVLTGLVPDPESIVEDLNLDRYVTDDGEVDTDAVAKLREKYAALSQPGRPRGQVDQGPRGAMPVALNDDALAQSIQNVLNAR